MPSTSELAKGAAMTRANLSEGDCRNRLKESELPFERHRGPAKGIANPVRVVAPIHGVTFQVPPKSTSFGLLDCRLALTLEDFARVLSEHDVVQVRIDNFYRRGARLPTKRHRRSQHAYGLAADVVSFTLRDGRVLDIEADWHGDRGQAVCGETSAVADEDEKGVLLRNLVCAIARTGMFHHILTPNYDRAHRNHLHLDIKRDNAWFSVR